MRPAPATGIALLALFVSLGGTTYAVTALPRNSVGTAQLRNRAVTEDKLAADAVVTDKLAAGAVRSSKIAPGAITGSRIARDGLGGDQIDESSLGTVPRAQEAVHAGVAARASVADRVERIDRVARADTAALADRATHAEHAERTDHTAVADSLANVATKRETVVLAPGDFQPVEVLCDLGLVPIGGGLVQTAGSGVGAIYTSGPVFDGWRVTVGELTGSGSATVDVSVVCIRAGRT